MNVILLMQHTLLEHIWHFIYEIIIIVGRKLEKKRQIVMKRFMLYHRLI